MTDDRRGDQGVEPVEPDDASDWLAAQFDGEVEVVEEGVDGGTEADADDDGASPPTRAFAPVARPDEEEAAAAPVPASAPEPTAPARAEPALPEAAEPESAEPESAQPEPGQPESAQPEPSQPEPVQPEPVLSVPPAPSADDEVPRSSGHPLALDLSGLAGAVVPDPPRGASTDAGDAPAAEDPHGPAVSPPAPAAPAPADPDEPGPFTALISAAPGEQAATPQEFRWEDLPAPEAEAAVPSAPEDGTDGGTHETSDEPEESRVEPADTSPESVAVAEAEAGAEADAPTRAVPLAPAADAAPAADDDVAAAQTTDADADTDADAAETPPDGSEAAAAAPWWVAEHHEMTRRERRQAEAAGLIVPPAGVATPATAPAAATPPAAGPAADPDDAAAPDAPAAGPAAGPSFTEILGIVPAARADDDPDPDSVEDVPGEASADAGRDDPIDETVPAAVDRVDAGTLDAAAVAADTSTTSWSLSGLDADGGDHAVRAGEPAVGPASPDLGAEPAPPAGSEAPLPFLTPSRPDLPLERARETRPSPEHLPGVDAASASADGRTSVFPVVAPAPGRSKGGPAGSGGIADWPRRRKVLLGVAAALVLVLALVAVFFLGRSLFAGAPSAAALSTAGEPAAASTRTVTAAPVVAEEPAAPAGPLAAGSHPWSDLQGGECLSAFENAWQQEYDVVDCAQPHAAQLVEKASLSDDPAAAWPGSDALRDQTGVLCTAPTAVDLAAAATLSDVQFVASWPTTAEEWAADRSYSCFVSRAGGEPLTASLAAA